MFQAVTAPWSSPNSTAERRERVLAGALLVLGVGGLLFRFWLAAKSIGSDDADLWLEHAQLIAKHGLRYAYQHPEANTLQYNHPPPMGYLSLWAYRWTNGDLHAFSCFMKVPGLLGEVLSAFLIWKIRSKRGAIAGALATAAFGWSLASIEVAGFHCNTDCAYASLCLLAFYLMHEKRAAALAGLALAAALNVKILPLLMVPPLLSQCRSVREAWRFSLASALALVPYLPWLLTIPKDVYRNMVSYNSQQLEWGIYLFLKYAREHSLLSSHLNFITPRFIGDGRYLVLGAIAGASLLAFCCSRRFAYHVGALAWALFLVLTPGFGVQYAVCVVPLLFAASPGTATIYGAASGLLLLFIYTANLTFKLPLHGYVQYYPFPPVAVAFGVLAWATMGVFTVATLRRLIADARDWTAEPDV
jgi:hypothetical protein